MAQLLTAMVAPIVAGEYAAAVRDTWLRRQLIQIGEDIVNLGFGGDPSLDGHGSDRRGRARPGRAGHRRAERCGAGEFGTAFDAFVAKVEHTMKTGKSNALMSGMPAVDAAFKGFSPEELIVLAGVPGAGKSGLRCRSARRSPSRPISAQSPPVQRRRKPGPSPACCS